MGANGFRPGMADLLAAVPRGDPRSAGPTWFAGVLRFTPQFRPACLGWTAQVILRIPRRSGYVRGGDAGESPVAVLICCLRWGGEGWFRNLPLGFVFLGQHSPQDQNASDALLIEITSVGFHQHAIEIGGNL